MSEPTPPQCIGIILDGNRRWAKQQGLPTLEGHRRGYERLTECIRWARNRGIKHLVVYAFSTENWNRSTDEVAGLMALAKEAIVEQAQTLADERTRTVFVGNRNRIPEDVQSEMRRAEALHIDAVDMTLWTCFSYGGRAEIAAAAQAALGESGSIDEESIGTHLWTKDMPDPEIIIRTGGRHRLSNFLLWQSAYSELFFLDTLWPEFSESDLDRVLAEFAQMQRNFGI